MATMMDFDGSLEALVNSLSASLGQHRVDGTVIIRDATGYLSAVLNSEIGAEELSAAEQALRDTVGRYARPNALLRSASGLGADRLLQEATGRKPTEVNGHRVRVLDRRIIGLDWLEDPAASAKGIPRLVFWSLKGGVGRSTALCIIASHLSRLGQRVLALDFDLEAPGIGTMLLAEAETPAYGTLDYLVESGIGTVTDSFVADMIGNSSLGSKGARVAIVPAVGKRTLDNPQNALSKIARAYIENVDEEGRSLSLSQQLSKLIDRLESSGAFDVILVDARAGLHESAAAALMGLGADVLLFGADQPQTYLGYRLLFSHLAQFNVDTADDWRDRLRFIHAKASAKEDERREAAQRFGSLYEIVAITSAPALEDGGDEFSADDFAVEWREDDAPSEDDPFEPPQIRAVIEDGRYRDFDPLTESSLLQPEIYLVSYAELLESVGEILNIEAPEDTKID